MTTEITPAFLGEALLLRWGESHKGRTVTFQLEPEGKEHPFKGYKCGDNGQRVKLVAVLIGDDEEPISAKPTAIQVGSSGEAKAQASKSKSHSWDTMSRSQRAALRLKSEAFQIWLAEKYPATWDDFYINQGMLSPEAADATLKDRLGIASKRDLDNDPVAASRFDSLLTDYDHRDMVR